MVGAHNPARGRTVRSHGRLGAHREAGFSLVELLVVVIMIAILAAIAIPNVRTASEGPSNPAAAIAGGTVWRAVQLARLESGGVMPTATQMANQAQGLVDSGGTRRIRPWPETGKGSPIPITTSTAAAPPTTGTANSLVYGVGPGARPTTGWLAAYGSKGTIVFRRVIAGGAPNVASAAGASAG
jgi:prepilin-type N-terminal cleavage/methylation domain-containing protein